MEARSKRKSLIIASLGIIIVISTIWWTPVQGNGVEVTTIYISRHAEKLDDSRDTPLSPAGEIRAGVLAHVLKDAGIEAVFVTQYKRTQQTAKPTAAAVEVEMFKYDAHGTQYAIEEKILATHRGKTILIVGHSNTVDDIAAGLGVTDVSELEESQFDRLFVVHLIGPIFLMERLRYGVETP